MPRISVVIPVYQSADCLQELHTRLVRSLGPVTDDFEILMIDDGSSDDSWSVIAALANVDPRVKGYRFSRNFGQHFGITAGLDLCDGDWIVVMDCDLQDRPEDIPRLYAVAQQGNDVVLARRRTRHDRAMKRLSTLVFYRTFAYLTDLPYDGAVGNFRMISRAVTENTRLLRERARFFGGIVWWLGYRVASVEVENDPRFAGESTYDFRKLIGLAVDMILAYSDKPLRLTVRFGLAIALFALAFGVYILIRALFFGVPVSGWASVMVSIYMLGGVTIGVIGMIGLYLSRVFDESKRRPLYIIRDNTLKGS
jgi:glycosyltransferase involved in cell wall biosynthesis